MTAKLICWLVVTSVVAVVWGQNQQGMPKCQSDFLQHLNTCFQNSQLVFNNFLWLVSNGTNGQAPDSSDSLKQDVCTKKEDLMNCGVEFMRVMINSTDCAPTQTRSDQRPLIDRQFRTLFGALDGMCAHPCRRTLPEDLRQCYVNAELDPTLFLSNATMGRGAVIGTTAQQADDFCIHKDVLIACMKQKRDECPESPLILRAIGLDIDSMETGVKVLCAHKEVYLTSIDCFAEPTEDVVACQRDMAQKTVELMTLSQEQNLPEEEFFKDFCGVRLDHVTCDLDSWRKKNHKACSEGVIGLRTELECGLLPDQCSSSQKSTMEQVCNPELFKPHLRSKADDKKVSAGLLITTAVLMLLR